MTTATRIRLVAGIVALALVSALIIRTSQAAFTAQTTNEGNAFEAATIQLTDTAQDALFRIDFNSGDLLPGQTIENCIPLTYSSGEQFPTRPVRLYSDSPVVGGLADALELRVDVGQGGEFDDCTGFERSGAPRFNGAMRDAGSGWDGVVDYASGVDLWTPAEGSESRTVRVRVTFDEQADNSYQGSRADGLDLTFEARS